MPYKIEKKGRHWTVTDNNDLVCITVYKCGAAEVVRRLSKVTAPPTDYVPKKKGETK